MIIKNISNKNYIGIAFQLIDDILDFISSTEILGKPNFGDLREGIITGPVLFALKELEGTQHFNTVVNTIKNNESLSDEHISTGFNFLMKFLIIWFDDFFFFYIVTKYIFESLGIEKTKLLALYHIEEALRILEEISDSKDSKAFLGLKSIAYSVITRNK